MSVSACWHYCESDLGGWQMEGHRLKASERTCSQVGKLFYQIAHDQIS